MFRIISILLLTSILPCAFALDACPNLSGTWAGTYQDPTHLFPAGNYPIRIQLEYNAGHLYGYTEKSNDRMAVGYGFTPYLIWGDCRHSTVKNLYVLPFNFTCGDPELKKTLIEAGKELTLNLHWENSMIDARLVASLHRISSHHKINGKYLSDAQNDSHEKITTCH